MVCPRCQSEEVYISKADRSLVQACRVGSPLTPTVFFVGLFNTLIRKFNADTKGEQFRCNKCNYAWYPKQEKLYAIYNRHLQPVLGKYSPGLYPGEDGSILELTNDRILIHHPKGKGCMIRLDELARIEFRSPMGPLPGRLSLHDRIRINKPFPQNLDAAKRDVSTIFFAPDYTEYYMKLRKVLTTIIVINKKRGFF